MDPICTWSGFIATTLLISGVLYCIKDFSGMKHEPYSLLNHFISELGDPRFAKHYRFFAFTFIVSGLLILPFIVGISLQISSPINIILLILGIICAVSCSLIGFVPEHIVRLHFIVAGFFFIGFSLLMLLVIIFGLLQIIDIFPPWFLYSSIILLVTFTGFLVDTATMDKKMLKLTDEPWNYDPRPRFWRNPFLEWVAFFSVVLWLYLLIGVNV